MPTEVLMVGIGVVVTVVLMGGGTWIAKIFRNMNDKKPS